MKSSLSQKIDSGLNHLLDFKGNYRIAVTQLSSIEKSFWWIALATYLVTVLMMGYNFFFVHYINYANAFLAPPAAAPGFALVYYCSLRYLKQHTRTCEFVLCILYTLAFLYFNLMICAGAMITPSPWLLSKQLLHADLWLGFNQLPLILWTKNHPTIEQALNFAYGSWTVQLFFLPLILVFCRQYQAYKQWFTAGMLAMLIVCLIYYIWPSLPPAYVFTQKIFHSGCYQCINRYFLIRQFQEYNVGLCGLIVFPSCHIIFATFNTYYLRKVRWLFYPLLALNLLLAASTIMMGMHFLVDVIGGFAVAALCIYCAERWSKQRRQPLAS
jgi:membrane-associated phospholipid phosphatase